MGEYAGLTGLIVIGFLLLLFLVILWILLPFAVFGTKDKLTQLIAEGKTTNQALQRDGSGHEGAAGSTGGPQSPQTNLLQRSDDEQNAHPLFGKALVDPRLRDTMLRAEVTTTPTQPAERAPGSRSDPASYYPCVSPSPAPQAAPRAPST